MKNTLLALSLSIIFISCSSDKLSHEEQIQLFQYKLNVSYSNADSSPLLDEDLESFKALEFFEIDESYRVEASLELSPDSPIFEMPTTTERLPLYRKYGVITFQINGSEQQLTLYQNQENMTSLEHGHLLFLPFNDLTNGNESYGGGRFIDVEIPSHGSSTIFIDFNKAYNPYCAYNPTYSCPITPKENNLTTDIRAGVKAFDKKH